MTTISTSPSSSLNQKPAEYTQFQEEVFPAELQAIANRRGVSLDTLKLPLKEKDDKVTLKTEENDVPPLREESVSPPLSGKDRFLNLKREVRAFFSSPVKTTFMPVTPTTKLGLIGLALSGGGIRSATFNLGVLQALEKHGILKQVDYLSTVSGGGYIGSCISSLLNASKTGPGDNFPFRHQPGIEEPQAIKHLRDSGNFLAPGGLMNKLRIPALLLRGVMINFIVLLPYIGLAVWFTDWFYGDMLRHDHTFYLGGSTLRNEMTFYLTRFYHFTPYAGGILLVWIMAFSLLQYLFQWRWNIRNKYEWSFGFLLLSFIFIALVESLPTAILYLNFNAWNLWANTKKWAIDSAIIKIVITALIPFLFSGNLSFAISKWTGKLAVYLLGLLGPLILLLIYFRSSYLTIFNYNGIDQNIGWYRLYWIVGGLFIYTCFCVDVNTTSLHNFYRDRLSRAYLFKQKSDGNLKPNDGQLMSTLNAVESKAPYHLINVALNLQGSEDTHLRGRDSDLFIFSKHYVGGERTGYCRTEMMESVDRHLNLGTAMAISGAAVAPNMGAKTIKPLAFVMTMLNIRMGYWLPNPRRLQTYWRWFDNRYSPFSGVGPVYLLFELLGRLNEKSRYVNLSDGGHIENLGVYELLRRRCKFIVACDAEADLNIDFGGLATLIRYARIDMGIDFDIDLDNLRKQEDGYSSKHWAIGKIYYGKDENGNSEEGYLLYIKASVTGNENEYIREYRSRHTDFPHESTTDQFFDEAQFETYRALGAHITNGLFLAPNQKPSDNVAEWIEKLMWSQKNEKESGRYSKKINKPKRRYDDE